MIAAGFLAQLAAQADAVAEAAIGRAVGVLAADAAEALPGVGVAAGADRVSLSAPGLGARAFGSRHRAADPRLTGLLLLLNGGSR